MQTSTRPIEAIAHARQLLHAPSHSGEWREMVYAEIVQLNRFIHEGEERLVVIVAEEPRHQTRALVTQLISARVDLERALAGPTVDDWNPAVLSGKSARSSPKPATTSSSPNMLVILVIGIGTIIAVLACAIAGALGLFGVLNVTGIPTVVDMPSGIEIPGIVQSQPTATLVMATFEPPAVLGAASITLPEPDAPPPGEDASRDLMGVMPSPVPVVIVPTVEQSATPIPTAAVPTAAVEAPPTEPPATGVPVLSGSETPTPMP